MPVPGTDPRATQAAGDERTPTADVGAGDADTVAAVAATVAELEDRLRRVPADLDNQRKRYAREVQAGRAAERNRATAA
jgi:molecular chaperone GrpE